MIITGQVDGVENIWDLLKTLFFDNILSFLPIIGGGSKALKVSGRSSSWHGAQKALSSVTFKSGEEYSFSVCANGSGNMMLSLQYTDASGKTNYDHIANGESSGDYVQLANPDYKLPKGSDFILYVETESGTGGFSIDEVIITKAGTQIDGPKPVIIIPGDVNCDSAVDAFDMPLLRSGLVDGLTGAAAKAADVNGDRQYTVADTAQIAEYIIGIKDKDIICKIDNKKLYIFKFKAAI